MTDKLPNRGIPVTPVPRSEWIPLMVGELPLYECPACGCYVYRPTNYCPSCGQWLQANPGADNSTEDKSHV